MAEKAEVDWGKGGEEAEGMMEAVLHSQISKPYILHKGSNQENVVC